MGKIFVHRLQTTKSTKVLPLENYPLYSSKIPTVGIGLYSVCSVSRYLLPYCLTSTLYSLVESGDQTAILRAGYWPSYNVPFYENIFNMSGYPSAEEKAGTDVSYQLCPRAKIFRRDQGNVSCFPSFKSCFVVHHHN